MHLRRAATLASALGTQRLSPLHGRTAAVEPLCQRDALLKTVDQYLQGLNMGLAGPLENIADDFVYRENNKTMDITTGVFFKQLPIDFNRTIVDEPACATFTESIHVSDPRRAPYVIGGQIRHHPADMSVYLIDVVASTTGDWLFNASAALGYAQQETDWQPLTAEEQAAPGQSRAALRAAADAYLDMWSNASAVAAVPWGTPCERLEGGAYTGNGSATDSCTLGVPTDNTQPPNSHRRYVIDVDMGSVDVFSVFEHLGNAPDSHLFRIQGGKLRHVHTITVLSNHTNVADRI
ncbi:hypothetical protein VTK73DRAFT_7364 [Phialemonium thermophilum]|uniref:DUF8021 domain-containing protein n=1 Tax=Phialemonium thermophilum TaxID=223376 RepID=A0ABR3WF70_9PEZI